MAYSKVHSRHELGNLVFYEEGNRQRWVDAIGPNAIKVLEDFGAYGQNWTESVVSAGSGTSAIANVSEAGGAIMLAAAGNDNDGMQIQGINNGFLLSPDDPVYFGARWKITGAGYGSADVIIGLCPIDTTLISGMTSGVYFSTADAATTILFTAEKASSATTQTIIAAGVVDTYYIDEFYWNGSDTLYAWHDGTAVTSHVTQIPTAASLTVSMAYLNGAAHGEGNAGLVVDWVRAIQLLSSR